MHISREIADKVMYEYIPDDSSFEDASGKACSDSELDAQRFRANSDGNLTIYENRHEEERQAPWCKIGVYELSNSTTSARYCCPHLP